MEKVSPPTIGKDVIESLTIGMYEDSKFIYREYIQNAADSIDKAVRTGLLNEEDADIFVTIEPDKQRIIIEDNATGISTDQVIEKLMNIAQSTKEFGVDKGFRGIGRLGGLGYCRQLKFETSAAGESHKTILTWNAELLKQIINDRTNKEEAASVIERITDIDSHPENAEKHYFKVILEGVTNDVLLDRKQIQEYLEMVAPLPFNGSSFIFKSKIQERLADEGLQLDEYNIYLGNEKDSYNKLHKAYTTIIYTGENGTRKEVDQIFEIEFFKEYDPKNKIIYWGWYGIRRQMIGQLKPINKARGLRVRKNNIQIGSDNTANRFFVKDPRFNFYFIGEIHAFHDHLIPNARRDYFTENDIFFKFESSLKEFCMYTLHNLCYAASNFNSNIKAIESYKEEVRVFEQKQSSNGFTNKEDQQTVFQELEKKKTAAEKAQKEIQKIINNASTDPKLAPLKHVVKNVDQQVLTTAAQTELPVMEKRPSLLVDQLTHLPKDQRKLLSRVFETIKKFHEKNVAESLVNKIIQELKQK